MTTVNAPASTPDLKKNWLRVLFLAFCGSIIYGLPYFKDYYYDDYLAIYQLTNEQMGSLSSWYGGIGILAYLVGGVLADRFSAKTLIVISLIATGAAGLGHLILTDYTVLCVIYALWGVTSLLTFWPALLKTVRMQASGPQQGRAYGLFEGGRGVVNALHLVGAAAVFAFAGAQLGQLWSIQGVIIFYSVIAILGGVLVQIFFKEGQTLPEGEIPEGAQFQWRDLPKVLTYPGIYLIIVLLFCSYTFNICYRYFTPFATNIFGATALFGAVLAIMAQYVRPFASAGGGFLADRVGRANVLLVGFVLMAVGTAMVLIIPRGEGTTTLLVIGCGIVYLGMYGNYGIFFSLVEEGGIPVKVAGTAIGVISCLAYLPEVIWPPTAGRILDSYTVGESVDATGYVIIFSAMAGFAIVGALVSVLWTRIYGARAKAAKAAKQAETLSAFPEFPADDDFVAPTPETAGVFWDSYDQAAAGDPASADPAPQAAPAVPIPEAPVATPAAPPAAEPVVEPVAEAVAEPEPVAEAAAEPEPSPLDIPEEPKE
ncbi:MAG: MFS transporter [Propionibacteriaceae bacterium]|jgi:MFS family permease|nr:MFS transporter [Propionibacteriaceae bacterium]